MFDLYLFMLKNLLSVLFSYFFCYFFSDHSLDHCPHHGFLFLSLSLLSFDLLILFCLKACKSLLLFPLFLNNAVDLSLFLPQPCLLLALYLLLLGFLSQSHICLFHFLNQVVFIFFAFGLTLLHSSVDLLLFLLSVLRAHL